MGPQIIGRWGQTSLSCLWAESSKHPLWEFCSSIKTCLSQWRAAFDLLCQCNKRSERICLGSIWRNLSLTAIQNWNVHWNGIDVKIWKTHLLPSLLFFQSKWLKCPQKYQHKKITHLSLSWSLSCSLGWPTSYAWPLCNKQAALPAGQLLVSPPELPVIKHRKQNRGLSF